MVRSLVAVLSLMVLAAPAAQTFGDKIGVELDGMGPMVFVDAAKTLRSWEGVDGKPIPKDESGWPKCDARTVIFDCRPCMAWAPPIDDPDAYQSDVSGTYKMSFNGQAELGAAEARGSWTVENQRYDAKTNLTTADITLKPGQALLFMTFTHTKRTADSAENTGVTNLRMIRPGYPADTTQTFCTEYLKALRPFAVLRFMDFTNTNGQSYNHAFFPNVLAWSDRKRVTDCTQNDDGNRHGAAWEYVVELANATGKDAWINIPVQVDDSYVRELAKLLKEKLKPDIKLYIEHGNEVWNFSFPQCTYNTVAAKADVAKGGSNLSDDGRKDDDTIRSRRHARRLVEITRIFTDVFGPQSFGQRIRPVLAWWTIRPNEYEGMLAWVQKNYGPPKDFFYGIATTGYFNVEKAPNGNVDQLLAAMKADCDANAKYWDAVDPIARKYEIKHVIYEGGPDTGGGKPENVANRIRANRDPRIADIVKYEIRDKWFSRGNDLFMYFSLCGYYSRYGCWGATDDIKKLNTPKYQALVELTGYKGEGTHE